MYQNSATIMQQVVNGPNSSYVWIIKDKFTPFHVNYYTSVFCKLWNRPNATNSNGNIGTRVSNRAPEKWWNWNVVFYVDSDYAGYE